VLELAMTLEEQGRFDALVAASRFVAARAVVDHVEAKLLLLTLLAPGSPDPAP
jgi:hypothetical protein